MRTASSSSRVVSSPKIWLTDCFVDDDDPVDGPAAAEMAANRRGRRDVCLEMLAERAVWMGTECGGEMAEVMVVARVNLTELRIQVVDLTNLPPFQLPLYHNNILSRPTHVFSSSTSTSRAGPIRCEASDRDVALPCGAVCGERVLVRAGGHGQHAQEERAGSKAKAALQAYGTSQEKEGGVSKLISVGELKQR